MGRVEKQAKDLVLGFLIKNPGIMTRRYNAYMEIEIYKKCPYCEEDHEQLIFHQFKCRALYLDA